MNLSQDTFILITEFLTLSDMKNVMLISKDINQKCNNYVWYLKYKNYYHSKREGRGKEHQHYGVDCLKGKRSWCDKKLWSKMEPYFLFSPYNQLSSSCKFYFEDLCQEELNLLLEIVKHVGCNHETHYNKKTVKYNKNVDFKLKLIPLVRKYMKKIKFTKQDEKELNKNLKQIKEIKEKIRNLQYFKFETLLVQYKLELEKLEIKNTQLKQNQKLKLLSTQI